MKKFIIGCAVLISLGANGAKAADVVFAQVLPLTGPIAANAIGLAAGSKAYFDKVNAAGGVNGNKIVVNTADDQYKPDETVRLVKELAVKGYPLAFINFTGAANIELVIKSGELEKNHIPLVGPRAGGQSLRNPVNPFIFHTYASYWDEVDYMVETFTTMGIKRFAVLYQDDAFGKDGFEGLKVSLKKRNIELVAAEPHARGSTNITAAGEKIMKANPQAVIFSTIGAAASQFVKEFRNKMPGVQFAGISAIDAATMVKQAGPTLARGFVAAANMPNPDKKSVALVREHQEALAKSSPGTKPNIYTLGGYATAKVVVEALKRAGPKPTREKFMAALESMKNFDIGGVLYTFSHEVRMGTAFVDLLVIDARGESQS